MSNTTPSSLERAIRFKTTTEDSSNRATIPEYKTKELLQDALKAGSLDLLAANFSRVADEKEDVYGNRKSEERNQVRNRLDYLRKLPIEKYNTFCAKYGVFVRQRDPSNPSPADTGEPEEDPSPSPSSHNRTTQSKFYSPLPSNKTHPSSLRQPSPSSVNFGEANSTQKTPTSASVQKPKRLKFNMDPEKINFGTFVETMIITSAALLLLTRFFCHR